MTMNNPNSCPAIAYFLYWQSGQSVVMGSDVGISIVYIFIFLK